MRALALGLISLRWSCLQAMYIRVKRMKATYFIQCDPTETVLDVKQKLFTLIEQPVSNQRLILMSTEEVLEDSKSLAEQKVSNILNVSYIIYATIVQV